MTSDPGETRNLLSDGARGAAALAELERHLEGQQKYAEAHQVGGGDAATITAAEEEALRALGYNE